MHANTNTRPRIARALAGGGLLGAIFEVGALCALEDEVDLMMYLSPLVPFDSTALRTSL